MSIVENLMKVKSELPDHVELVAVSKTYPNEIVLEAYGGGQRHFGENKVQEICLKQEQLPKDIHWHLIGHLQTNKVKFIVPFVHLIHAVDSLKLLQEINKRAAQNRRVVSCLLQVHIAKEDTKFGFNREELMELVRSERIDSFVHVKIQGLMGMATFTSDLAQVRTEFDELKSIFDEIAEITKDTKNIRMDTLSMGMSGDYQIAIEAGSNMIRVGSAIFGTRS